MTHETINAPTYVLTAELDGESFAWLDGLRRRHFPPERNVLSAHLTMFHRLSPAQVALLDDVDLAQEPPQLQFEAPMFLGSGVAVRVQSSALERLRSDIRDRMGNGLSRQDSQTWRPHVTVQNKVAAHVATELYQSLERDFVPFNGSANALLVWEYLGGPWKFAQRLGFTDPHFGKRG